MTSSAAAPMSDADLARAIAKVTPDQVRTFNTGVLGILGAMDEKLGQAIAELPADSPARESLFAVRLGVDLLRDVYTVRR